MAITTGKKELYNALKSITSFTYNNKTYAVEVYQNRPEVLSLNDDKLIITFNLLASNIDYELLPSVTKQAIIYSVDLYGYDSGAVSALADTVQATLQNSGILLTGLRDVPDAADARVVHLACEYKLIK